MKYERNDPFTFCALGWLHFTLGREAKSSSELAERPKQYLRSAEAYERALTLDPKSAVAAQGLAIALAEDTLTPGAVDDPGTSIWVIVISREVMRRRLSRRYVTPFQMIRE
jgi:hypothetical protein